MARPKKNNADYFTHDNNMRNDRKIKAVRKAFGHEGYAIYNMLLESIADAEGFKLKLTDMELRLLAADFDVTAARLNEIIAFMVGIELFVMDSEKYLFSQTMLKRMSPLVFIREKDRLRKEAKKEAKAELKAPELPLFLKTAEAFNAENEPTETAVKSETPEKLIEFAKSVFTKEERLNGAKNSFDIAKIPFSNIKFDEIVRKWALWQIEHGKHRFTEVQLYSALCSWILREAQFKDNKQPIAQNLNGKPQRFQGESSYDYSLRLKKLPT